MGAQTRQHGEGVNNVLKLIWDLGTFRDLDYTQEPKLTWKDEKAIEARPSLCAHLLMFFKLNSYSEGFTFKKKAVSNVFSDQFGILNLPETE